MIIASGDINTADLLKPFYSSRGGNNMPWSIDAISKTNSNADAFLFVICRKQNIYNASQTPSEPHHAGFEK
jgi:hypothetical protein